MPVLSPQQEDVVDRPPSADPTWGTAAAMALLARGVPLSLLLDLALGPHSEDLLRHERPAGQPAPADG
jgi:hypothetical protein